MTVRIATPADLDDLVAIWQENVVFWRTWHPTALPDWDRDFAERKILRRVAAGLARLAVSLTPAGEIRAAAFVLRHVPYLSDTGLVEDTEALVIWMVKFVRRANGTVNQAATITRFNESMTELFEAWCRAAQADGVAWLQGSFSEAGPAASLAFLDAITTRSGVQPEIRGGMRRYLMTPAQLLVGVGAVS